MAKTMMESLTKSLPRTPSNNGSAKKDSSECLSDPSNSPEERFISDPLSLLAERDNVEDIIHDRT